MGGSPSSTTLSSFFFRIFCLRFLSQGYKLYFNNYFCYLFDGKVDGGLNLE
jgi:hypothetical protein